MEAIAIVAYVVCDDVVKNLKIREDKQCRMSLAETMTTAIIAASEFGCNIEKARKALSSRYYIPKMLSKSQLNRRLHKIDKFIWKAVLKKLRNELVNHGIPSEFIVDSAPVRACMRSRWGRNKMFCEKEDFGYCASQNEFFIGLKMHMICDDNAMPVELLLEPASKSDVGTFRKMSLADIPKNALIIGDKAYNDYKHEDMLVQKRQIHLLPIRKKNSKRKGGGHMASERRKKRKKIETAFSCIGKLMPRAIHAVTKKGFKLKVLLFVVAYAFSKAF